MYCGLDFGTSNSTISIYKDGKPVMVPVDKEKTEIRSAIFMNNHENSFSFGKQAIDEYLSHEEGRLLTSLKSVLGSSLMDEKTKVFNEMMSFTEILGLFIYHIKKKAENYCGVEIENVVLGRPVRFNDEDDTKDKKAEDTLRTIAMNQGFKNIFFQYEPIAAANAYMEENHVKGLSVIVDIGGGTSDFTVLDTTNKQTHDIITTAGIHIGGTDIDRLVNLKKVMPLLGMNSDILSSTGKRITIPSTIYHDLSTWHKINSLYSIKEMNRVSEIHTIAIEKEKTGRLKKALKNKEGHRIIDRCEKAKIALSKKELSKIDLDFIENNLLIDMSIDEFNKIILKETENIVQTLFDMNNNSNINPDSVNAVFFTGGSSEIKLFRKSIMNIYKNAKAIRGSIFSSVGKGLAIEANKKFT